MKRKQDKSAIELEQRNSTIYITEYSKYLRRATRILVILNSNKYISNYDI